MIIPDLNLLDYACNDGAPDHQNARTWWEDLVNGSQRIGIPWVVTAGFVRLMTHPKVLTQPLAPEAAVALVFGRFQYPPHHPDQSGCRPPAALSPVYRERGSRWKPHDRRAHRLLAMEVQGEVHSNDTDFGRFPGLRWINPLSS